MKRLLFIGDSMIEYFDWQQRFRGYEVLNKGLSGETVTELFWRSKRLIPEINAPDLVLIMIGTNNVAMEDFSFVPVYRDIIAEYRQAFPAAVIVVNSLLPMQLFYFAADTVVKMNEKLQKLAEESGVLFLDAHGALADKNGTPRAGVLADEVHLTMRGYGLWADSIEGFLKKNFNN